MNFISNLVVFAVMGRGLFYEWAPNKFGNLWLSFVTLFQLLTLDDWFELMDSTGDTTDNEETLEAEFAQLEEADQYGYWLMFGYLFAYLVIEYFVFLKYAYIEYICLCIFCCVKCEGLLYNGNHGLNYFAEIAFSLLCWSIISS